MRCRAAKRRIAGYLYGELSPAERARVDEHMARCAACRGELELTRQGLAAMPQQAAPPLTEGERAEMMRSVRRGIRTAAAARERARRWAWSWAAVALVAGAVGTGLWYTRGPAPRTLVAVTPSKPPAAGPAAAKGGGSEAGGPVMQPEARPGVLAVADAEIEFVTRTRAEPTAAPAPIGNDDMRMTP
jgi:anti-sigma factor RsiW